MAAPVSSPNSASNSQVSAPHSSLAKVEPPPDESKEITGSDEQSKEPIKDPIDILEGDEYIEKLQRYEADYKQYLMSKYFPGQTIFGGNENEYRWAYYYSSEVASLPILSRSSKF